MKQRITVEQLNELNHRQKMKLFEFWKPGLGDWIYNPTRKEIGVICGVEGEASNIIHVTWYYGGDSVIQLKGATLPLLTIGQMIELLYNCHTCISIEVGTQGFFASVKAGVKNKQTEEELCDALWEATKRMLDVLIDV